MCRLRKFRLRCDRVNVMAEFGTLADYIITVSICAACGLLPLRWYFGLPLGLLLSAGALVAVRM